MIKPVIGRPPQIIDLAVHFVQTDPEGFMGPWYLGLIALTFMTGVLANQTTNYFHTFGCESLRLFLLVVSCLLLSFAQWVVILIAEWDWCVQNYGDWRRFAVVPWESAALPIITELTVFASQLFFASRCYVLYGRSKLLFGILLLGMTASLVSFILLGVAIAIDPFNFPLVGDTAIPGLAFNVATDIAITGLTLWKIGHGGKMYSPRTQNGLRRLRNMTIEAAVPPTICVILNISVYIATHNKNLISHCFAILTPTVYVWSMMFTLNSRVAVSKDFNPPTTEDSQSLSTGFQFAHLRSSHATRGQVDSQGLAVVATTMPKPLAFAQPSTNLSQEPFGGNDNVGDIHRDFV